MGLVYDQEGVRYYEYKRIEKVTEFAVSIGFSVLEITFSPIKGPEGNIEYLVHLKKCPEEEAKIETKELDQVVDEAFAALAK